MSALFIAMSPGPKRKLAGQLVLGQYLFSEGIQTREQKMIKMNSLSTEVLKMSYRSSTLCMAVSCHGFYKRQTGNIGQNYAGENALISCPPSSISRN